MNSQVKKKNGFFHHYSQEFPLQRFVNTVILTKSAKNVMFIQHKPGGPLKTPGWAPLPQRLW